MSYIFIIIGLFLLIKGADYFVEGCSSIAKSLGIPTLIIGLTIVALGTSAPEAAVSITASIKGANEIAIGNVVGSNIFNIFFILGLSSTISPITYGFETFIDIIVMTSASIIVYLLLLKNKRIGNKKGIILLAMYISYMVYILIR